MKVLSAVNFRLLPAILTKLGFAMALILPVRASAGQEGSGVPAHDEVAAIEAVVDAYHEALAVGDRDTAVRLLSAEVMVLESGGVETAEEYLSHHLAADMAYSAAVPSQRQVIEAVVEGDVGWVISSSSSRGEFRGREIDSAGAELMVLSKEAGGWKIRVIHWSSRSRKR